VRDPVDIFVFRLDCCAWLTASVCRPLTKHSSSAIRPGNFARPVSPWGPRQHGSGVEGTLRTAGTYRRREPETSVLYQVVAQHLEKFLARAQADASRPGLPWFVVRELRAFLDCGQHSRGFCRVKCSTCGDELLVAFACKRRSFCPSCCARRMSDLAAHLTDRVLPDVPVRQWVLTVPFPLRYPLAYDPDLCREVKGLFIRAVLGWTRRRAERAGNTFGRTGAVVATHRCDSALRLAPHFHAIVLDGVFSGLRLDQQPCFHAIDPPTEEDVARLVRTVRDRVLTLFRRRGRLSDEGELLPPDVDDPTAFDVCQVAAVQGRIPFGAERGQPVRRLRRCPDRATRSKSPLCADLDGFSLQAQVSLPQGAHSRREALARYLTRPPLAPERLSLTAAGRVRYRLGRTWRDGTSAIELDPMTFLARLAALVPRPGVHLLTYHGLLAPAASYRNRVVPEPPDASEDDDPEPCHRRRAEDPARPGRAPRRPRMLWADLLARAFTVDVLRCPCGGRRRLLTFLTDPIVIERILAHLDLPPRPRPAAHARPPPEPEHLGV
jgi:hypothetical protein